MPVSETLFHFTSELEYLKSMISNCFYPRLSLEDTDSILGYIKSDENSGIAFPMVCFCDIPLSQVKPHLDEYGYYGIGLKKEWGLYKGLSPITYLPYNSLPHRAFTDLNDFIRNNMTGNEKLSFEAFKTLWLYIPYLKKYKGTSHKNESEKVFYEEREWRYVPPFLYEAENHDSIIPFLDKKEFKTKRKDEVNKSLEKHPLTFEVKDINYIFISNENERIILFDYIDKINSMSDNDKSLLKSKINCSKDLLKDI